MTLEQLMPSELLRCTAEEKLELSNAVIPLRVCPSLNESRHQVNEKKAVLRPACKQGP